MKIKTQYGMVEVSEKLYKDGLKKGLTKKEIGDLVYETREETRLDRAAYAEMSQDEKDAHDNIG